MGYELDETHYGMGAREEGAVGLGGEGGVRERREREKEEGGGWVYMLEGAVVGSEELGKGVVVGEGEV